MNHHLNLTGTLAAALFAVPAMAQSAPPADPFAGVDPATIRIPDLNFTPHKEATDNYWKYFIFHKDGVDFDTALADVAECEGYSKINDMFVPVPSLVPYRTASKNPASKSQDKKYAVKYNPFYGLLGFAMFSGVSKLTIGPVLARLSNTNQRACMGFKGYKAYGVTEDIWKSINKVDIKQEMLMKAKIASGPIPALPESTP